jgi:tetratricopeptide (TPR) repeat protein
MATTATANSTVLLNRATSAYNASNFALAIEQSRAALIVLDTTLDEQSQVVLDRAFERLTLAYQRIGNFAVASQVVNEWRRRTLREEGRVQSLIQEARLDTYQGNYDSAERLIDKAIRKAESMGYFQGMGSAKRCKADLYWKQGQAEKALTISREALVILEQAGDFEQQAAARVAMAASYHATGQFYQSIQQLQQAYRIVEQLGRTFEQAIILSNLGESYAQLFAAEKALAMHQQALDLIGIDRAHPDLIRNLGVDLVTVNRNDEGLKYLSIALERAQWMNDPDLIAHILYSLSEVDLKAGRLKLAEERGQSLMDRAHKLKSVRHRIHALMILGEIAWQQHDVTKANTLFSECSMAAQEAADRHAIWQTHARLYDIFRDTNLPLAGIHHRIAEEMIRHILLSIEDDNLRKTFREAEPVRLILGHSD